MSTLSSFLRDLLSLLFPAYCAGCNEKLSGSHEWICLRCQASMPSTYFHLDAENPMAAKLKSLCPSIENATAQFFYINKGHWRSVIHQIKYHNGWLLARKLGYWYGCELLESPIYQDIDVVVPVPLHPSRLLKRRYNQSEKIAEGVASALGIKVCRRAIVRQRNNPSQVTKLYSKQRWENVQGIFKVVRPEELEGKHLLLIDDVFTTGATIVSCIEEIQQKVSNCRISVATLAASRNEIIGRAI